MSPSTAETLLNPEPVRQHYASGLPEGAPFNLSMHMARFSVPYRYPVIFTEHAFNPDNPALAKLLGLQEPKKRHRVLVLIDAGLAEAMPRLVTAWNHYSQHHNDIIEPAGDPIVVPGGETAKDDLTLQERLSQYIEMNNIDRHSFVLALGGGAMLDAVGLAAATAHRGVRLIRMPSTVLAQNDAGIGVKNGINRFGQKNWYGSFHPPFAVLNDHDLLRGLDRTHRRSGMAEAVKVALIRDAVFFDWIESQSQALAEFEPTAVRYLIEQCALLHLKQITQGGDPFERGTARPLDFGHWAAHRLETITRHRLTHGDAVAIGIALDSLYSCLSGLISEACTQRILNVLRALGFTLYDPALNERDPHGHLLLLTGLSDFQRHLGGELTVTLLQQIGTGMEVHRMDESLIEQAIGQLQTGDNA